MILFPQLRMVMVSLLFSSPPLSRAFRSSRGASIVVVLSFLPAAADGLRSSLSASQLCTMSHPLRDPRFFLQLRMMLLLFSARTDTTVAHVGSSCFLQLRMPISSGSRPHARSRSGPVTGNRRLRDFFPHLRMTFAIILLLHEQLLPS
jgi:hypothetical protein